jgi:hypothetical protein
MSRPHLKIVDRSTTVRRERGAVMFVAVVVLLMMTLAGVAMMRQMRSELSIAGNLAFKQNATAAADRGTEAARDWYAGQTLIALRNDAAGDGYFSSFPADSDEVDPAELPWNQARSVVTDDGAGNRVDYLVHRLCTLANTAEDDPAQQCAGTLVNHGSAKACGYPCPSASEFRPYFRVTTRVRGPRNTLSYVQVVMY